ncbi:MAG TPA: hypothetical protein VGO62_13130, partial [Myxococcota bacterium]
VARALVAVATPETAASLFSLLWLVLAAPAGAYLASSFGVSRRGAVVAAFALPLMGTSIDLVLHGPYVVAPALTAAAWGGARNLRRRHQPRARDVVMLASALALLALHGDLQTAFLAGMLAVAEGVASLVKRRGKGLGTRFVPIGAAALAGTLLAGLQIVPSAGLGSAVARAHGVESTTVDALELPEALGALLPVVAYRRVDDGASIVTAFHGDRGARIGWNSSPFLGALAIAALLSMLGVKRGRPVAALALIALLLALGTPLLTAATTLLPPLALFRYPAKYFALTSLCAPIALALAVDATRSVRLRRRIALVCGAVAALLVLALAVVVVEGPHIDLAASRVATHAPDPALSSLRGSVLLALCTSLVFAAAAALGLGLWGRASTSSHPSRWVGLWLAALALLELGVAAARALPLSAPLFTGDAPLVAARPLQALPAGALLCIGHDVKAVHLASAAGELQLAGDTVADVLDGKPNIGACGGPPTPDDYMPSSQHTVVRLSRYLQDEAHGVLGPARALGCTHVVTRADVSAQSASLTRVPLAPSPGAPVYALVDALPDVAVAPSPQLVQDEAALLAAITTSSTSAQLLALVDDPASTLALRSRPALPDGARAGAVSARFDDDTHGIVTVTGSGGAVIALRRAWWPGWTATQAGAPIATVRVAGHGLGLVVDDVARGPIELRYSVRFLAGGIASAAAGALVLAALACVLLAQRRRRARQTT